MKKNMIYCLLILSIITLGAIIIGCSSNPLQESKEQIRERMLEFTPIGTNMSYAVETLERISIDNDWESMNVNNRFGVDITNLGLNRDEIETLALQLGLDDTLMVGEQSIRATLGRYRSGIGYMLVDVRWAFDENSELIEVFVQKLTAWNP